MVKQGLAVAKLLDIITKIYKKKQEWQNSYNEDKEIR